MPDTQSHLKRAWAYLVEAYNPDSVWKKILPVLILRIGKVLALIFNAGVGYFLLGWAKGESRVLDLVGRGTEQLFWELYGRELNKQDSIAFLFRRLYFCVLTVAASVVQVSCELFRVHSLSLIIAIFLSPITLLDRQWCTLVSRMQQLTRSLSQALAVVFPEHCIPTKFGLGGSYFIMMGVEMIVAATQAVAGALIVAYTVMRPLGLLPWDANDLRVLWVVAGLRFFKEISNIISPCIEIYVQPERYRKNEECVVQAIHALTAAAPTPHELALLVHKHPNSQASFERACNLLLEQAVCHRRGAWREGKRGVFAVLRRVIYGGGKQKDVEMEGSGWVEGEMILEHCHSVDCLPAYIRHEVSVRGQSGEAMLKTMLEIAQLGPCWWETVHVHTEAGHDSLGESRREHMHKHLHQSSPEDVRVHSHARAANAHDHVHTHVLPGGLSYDHTHDHCHSHGHQHGHGHRGDHGYANDSSNQEGLVDDVQDSRTPNGFVPISTRPLNCMANQQPVITSQVVIVQ